MEEESSSTKFDYFDVSTVRLFAESRCFSEDLVNDYALECLTGDLNYRLREIAHKCAILMYQKRRRKLTVDDVNLTLKWYNCAPILGHKSIEPPKLHYLKELTAFVPNEGMVDLCDFALANNFFPVSPEPHLQGGLVFNDDYDHNEKFDSRVVEMCKNSLVEILSLRSDEFRKALRLVTEFSEKEDVCIYFAKFMINFLQKTKTDREISKILDICFAVFQSKTIKTNIKMWPLVQKLSEYLLEFSTNLSFPNSSEKSCRILFFLSRNFQHVSSVFVNNIVSYWIETLSNENNDIKLFVLVLNGLHAFSSNVKFDDIKSVLSTHIQRFFNLNTDISSFDSIVYFSLWRSIAVKLLNNDIKVLSYDSKSSKFWSVLTFFAECFGDSWMLNAPLTTITNTFEQKFNDESKILSPKIPSKEKILEDLIENSRVNDEVLSTPNDAVIEKHSKTKKRKRKREPSDLFDIPKRFRLSHQRDIVFIFHQTEATTVKTGQKFDSDIRGRTEFSSIFNQKPFVFQKRPIKKFQNRISIGYFDVRSSFL